MEDLLAGISILSCCDRMSVVHGQGDVQAYRTRCWEALCDELLDFVRCLGEMSIG